MSDYSRDCFHIHTYRCGHAGNAPDEEYIEAAINAGAAGIWFTDHAPFPGDPFKNRMKYSELDEYLSSLKYLKHRYAGTIAVHIGLEIEYFPSFDEQGYYRQLSENPDIELLLLGQHMAECEEGYTFLWEKERLNMEEYIALGNAEIQGMNSGYFGVVAHPDRIFRRQKKWSEGMQLMTRRIVDAVRQNGILLEQNESSKREKHHYWNEFWKQARDIQIVHGLDAHAPEEITRYFIRKR